MAPNIMYENTYWRVNLVCQILFLIVPGFLLVLRSYVRKYINRAWVLEDYFSWISYICLVVFAAIAIVAVLFGAGIPNGALTPHETVDVFYWVNVSQVWYGVAACFIRSTVLLLYLRIFSPCRKSSFWWAVNLILIANFFFYVITTFLKVMACKPRERIWDHDVDGVCIDMPTVLTSSGVFNIVCELAIILAPVPAIVKMKQPLHMKIKIFLVFTVGFGSLVANIMGFVARLHNTPAMDRTDHQAWCILWASAELAMGNIVVCLPNMPALWKHLEARYKWLARRPVRNFFHCMWSFARGRGWRKPLSPPTSPHTLDHGPPRAYHGAVTNELRSLNTGTSRHGQCLESILEVPSSNVTSEIHGVPKCSLTTEIHGSANASELGNGSQDEPDPDSIRPGHILSTKEFSRVEETV